MLLFASSRQAVDYYRQGSIPCDGRSCIGGEQHLQTNRYGSERKEYLIDIEKLLLEEEEEEEEEVQQIKHSSLMSSVYLLMTERICRRQKKRIAKKKETNNLSISKEKTTTPDNWGPMDKPFPSLMERIWRTPMMTIWLTPMLDATPPLYVLWVPLYA